MTHSTESTDINRLHFFLEPVWYVRQANLGGYLYLAQCKWRNAFTVSFGVRIRVRVRLFSPLCHLHCAEYRKPIWDRIRVVPDSSAEWEHCSIPRQEVACTWLQTNHRVGRFQPSLFSAPEIFTPDARGMKNRRRKTESIYVAGLASGACVMGVSDEVLFRWKLRQEMTAFWW